jgi:hypothetical protein
VIAHGGQEIVFVVDADRPGGVEVRSSPEQRTDFSPGGSNISFRIDAPGQVRVRESESEDLIAEIEVE